MILYGLLQLLKNKFAGKKDNSAVLSKAEIVGNV
jgi:hypothetical protein